MSFFLGVDGGNTKTLAVIVDRSGRVLGTGRAGNGDIYGAESPEAAMAAVSEAVDQAKTAAGVQEVAHGAFSIAGADWPEDYAYIGDNLRKHCGQIRIVNDSYGALRAGTTDGVGVSVICGTYGTCGAASRDGRRWQGGFWHRAESGGVPLGQAVLNLVYDAHLGIAGPTCLTEQVLAFYGAASVEEMLHSFTRRNGRVAAREGALVGLLFEASLAGDDGAKGIVEFHGRSQGKYAIAGAQYVGLEGSFPLVISGGVMRFKPNPMEPVIIKTVKARYPGAEPTRARFEPVFGAILLAFDHSKTPVDADMEAMLTATDPGPDFYDSRAN